MEIFLQTRISSKNRFSIFASSIENIIFLICVFCLTSCSYTNISKHITPTGKVPVAKVITVEEDIPVNKKECVINTAESFVGVQEIGNNESFDNLELKTLLLNAGWKKSHAWCSYMVKGLLDHCDVPNKVNGYSPSSYNKLDVIYTDNEYKKEFNRDDILVLSLSYSKYKNDKSRYKAIGHTGIVYKLTEDKLYSYEGNTFEDSNLNDNEGQGFYKKIRPLSNNTHITRYKYDK